MLSGDTVNIYRSVRCGTHVAACMLFGDTVNIYQRPMWHKRGGVYAVRRRSEHLSERPM